MKISKFLQLVWLTAVLFILSGCSVEISQTQIVPTRTSAPPTNTPIPPTNTSTATITLTSSPTEPGAPTPTSTPTPTPTPAFPFPPVDAPEVSVQVHPEYASLNARGRILFLHYDDKQGQSLIAFDLSTGDLTTLFHTSPTGSLTSLSVSPDADQILISFAPPPPEGKVQSGYADLVLLTPDQPNVPQVFLPRTKEVEGFYSVVFSPDQEYIYYLHYFEDKSDSRGVRYTFDRMPYPEGTPEMIVSDNPFYPRLSPDGTQVAYVIYDLVGSGPDELYTVNSDGSNPTRVLDPVEYPFVDAPFFSPDNQYLYFGAVISDATPPPLTWWEKLMGIHIAFAHPVPSDLFRVSLADGRTERVTELLAIGIVGTFSPDGQWIGFITDTGLYMMRPDGSDLVPILDIKDFTGTSFYGNVEWIP